MGHIESTSSAARLDKPEMRSLPSLAKYYAIPGGAAHLELDGPEPAGACSRRKGPSSSNFALPGGLLIECTPSRMTVLALPRLSGGVIMRAPAFFTFRSCCFYYRDMRWPGPGRCEGRLRC